MHRPTNLFDPLEAGPQCMHIESKGLGAPEAGRRAEQAAVHNQDVYVARLHACTSAHLLVHVMVYEAVLVVPNVLLQHKRATHTYLCAAGHAPQPRTSPARPLPVLPAAHHNAPPFEDSPLLFEHLRCRRSARQVANVAELQQPSGQVAAAQWPARHLHGDDGLGQDVQRGRQAGGAVAQPAALADALLEVEALLAEALQGAQTLCFSQNGARTNRCTTPRIKVVGALPQCGHADAACTCTENHSKTGASRTG
jgi:hypothetical protein